jgi:hypothetical protein
MNNNGGGEGGKLTNSLHSSSLIHQWRHHQQNPEEGLLDHMGFVELRREMLSNC